MLAATRRFPNLEYEAIRFEVEGALARITLARPEVFNAMSRQLMKELATVAIECDESPAIRAILLTGEGKAFCAGGDLEEFAGVGDQLSSHLKELTMFLHAALSRFARMDPPLVIAVNGVAAGAGLSLAASGDLVIAGESAKFTVAYTKAGLVPDGSSTFYLPRLIGLRRAQELIFTNRVIDAATALDWGLVTRVVSDGDLLSESESLARKMADGPTLAFGAAKSLLLASTGDSIEAQMEREARRIADAVRSVDGREGIAAFVAKRKPVFQGH